MNTNKTDITPDTKIADLLLHYPTLEQTLKDYSSAFAALDNPALRDTVAKATSLQQLAKAGGGIGDYAMRYGYNEYNYALVYRVVTIMIVIVFSIQIIGNRISKNLDKKRRIY